MFGSTWKCLLSGTIMFVPVFWLNTHMKSSWLWLLIEVIVGISVYSCMIFLLRAPIIGQLKDILYKRKKRRL